MYWLFVLPVGRLSGRIPLNDRLDGILDLENRGCLVLGCPRKFESIPGFLSGIYCRFQVLFVGNPIWILSRKEDYQTSGVTVHKDNSKAPKLASSHKFQIFVAQILQIHEGKKSNIEKHLRKLHSLQLNK